mgnify:CR=1 FL=1
MGFWGITRVSASLLDLVPGVSALSAQHASESAPEFGDGVRRHFGDSPMRLRRSDELYFRACNSVFLALRATDSDYSTPGEGDHRTASRTTPRGWIPSGT